MIERKPRILVVDDEDKNQKLLEAMLLPLGYDVILASEGDEATNKIQVSPPDVILLDIMMPGMNGFEVAQKLKNNVKTKNIPIVMVTSLNEVEDRVKALESGADDFLTKPVDKTELKARVQSLVKVKHYNDYMQNYQKELEDAVARRTAELKKAYENLGTASLDTIYRLSRAAEYKDEDTGMHIMRMSHYSAAIARKLGFSDKTVDSILYASPMHDIGKIGIPDRILLKPGKLDADEWEIMKQHTVIGAHILSGAPSGFLNLAETVAITHHEKWDGSGYPKGLKGDQIPKAGRITALADVFDALMSKRPYKEPFPLEKTLEIVKEGKGSHFDPEIIDAFFEIQDEILSIKEKYKDQEESRFVQMIKKTEQNE